VLCFSLILLSVDLGSPHVKNKMSKREFIRNTRNAVIRAGPRPNRGRDDDGSELLGEMYDNIFLRGHVSGEGKPVSNQHQRFVPGYLAIFL
jgi:F-box protein 8